MLDALYRALRPALFLLDPETAHHAAVAMLRLVPARAAPVHDPILATEIWGWRLPNPIGLAAGFDKHAEAPDALLGLGFGHVEVGGVTPRPQPGNPRPRVFRLAQDRAVINRYGLNSQGLDAVAARLEARRRKGHVSGCVGVNLGKNKETADEAADYAEGASRLSGSADYLVINVSSPNTPGLRDLQGRDTMRRIIVATREARDAAVTDIARRPPLLVKLAPDLDEAALADIAEVALATGLDGLVMGNTTVTRPRGLAGHHRVETGGLSGAPLAGLSLERLASLYRLTQGRVPLVGCGGIASGADAYARIRAGASLVQFYSAMIYEGPGLVVRMARDLAALLHRDGFANVQQAVGADRR